MNLGRAEVWCSVVVQCGSVVVPCDALWWCPGLTPLPPAMQQAVISFNRTTCCPSSGPTRPRTPGDSSLLALSSSLLALSSPPFPVLACPCLSQSSAQPLQPCPLLSHLSPVSDDNYTFPSSCLVLCPPASCFVLALPGLSCPCPPCLISSPVILDSLEFLALSAPCRLLCWTSHPEPEQNISVCFLSNKSLF